MKAKKLFNFKRALNSPYMIQKLYKGFTLENPIKVEKFVVFFGTWLFLLTFGKPLMFILSLIPGLAWAGYLLIPIGVTLMWDRVEPDGLKITDYVLDMIVYLCTFVLGKKKIANQEIIKNDFEVVVFEKIA